MNNFQLFIFITILITVLHSDVSEGANILFYFGVATYSHRMAVWPLVEELAAQGHSVTFLSGFPPKPAQKNPKVVEYVPKSLAELMEKTVGGESDLIKNRAEGNAIKIWHDVETMGSLTCEVLMKDPDYVNWIKTTKFDVVIIDILHNDCALGIAKYQKSPFIIYGTSHPLMWALDQYGAPAQTSWISDLAIDFPGEKDMSFYHRVLNTLSHLYWHYSRVFFMYPKIEKAINEALDLTGEEKLDIRQFEKTASLVLQNTHYSFEHARALPPLWVSVGGMHVIKQKVQPLPTAMKKFVDESGEGGFIYISFGTGAQISKADPEVQKQFFYALGNSTGVRFLWKWESDLVPAEMPKNVFTSKWMPQADILAHPKIKAFVTHGGLLSIQESIDNGVPLIVFPLFAEQEYNAGRMQNIGCGIRLEIVGIKQSQIEDAIHRISTDSKYKNKMKEVSTVFHDRQNPPMETAIWWIEYVIRHKKTPFLMPQSAHQSWYVTRLLDVWGAIFGPFFVLFGTILGYCLNNLVNGKRGSNSGHKIKTK